MAYNLIPEPAIYLSPSRLASLLYPSTQIVLVEYFPASSQLKHLSYVDAGLLI
jgi:hypothetical protein